MLNFRRIFTAAVFLVIGSGLVKANSITYDFTVPSTAVTFSQTFTVPTFDATLGHLDGVTISADASFVLSTDVFNGSGPGVDGDLAQTESYANLYGNGGVTITGPSGLSFTVNTANTVANSNLAGLASGGFESFDNPAVNGSASTTLSSGTTDLSAWELGTGPTVSLNFNATTLNVLASTTYNDLYFGIYGTASGSMEVVYTYSVLSGTPEPSTWVLLGSALIAAFFFRKRLALR